MLSIVSCRVQNSSEATQLADHMVSEWYRGDPTTNQNTIKAHNTTNDVALTQL